MNFNTIFEPFSLIEFTLRVEFCLYFTTYFAFSVVSNKERLSLSRIKEMKIQIVVRKQIELTVQFLEILIFCSYIFELFKKYNLYIEN